MPLRHARAAAALGRLVANPRFGSTAAGFVLLIRLLMIVLPRDFVRHWSQLLMGIAAVTILYGSLCAIPQRNLKRLLGYSSIANGGYLLLGIASLSVAGSHRIDPLAPPSGRSTTAVFHVMAMARARTS